MFGLLKRLFGNGSRDRLVLDGFWCDTPIKLPTKAQTPMGSRVSVVNVCVDIQYSIEGDNIVLHRVQLARGGGRIAGSSTAVNVASERTGEAWSTSQICPESYLVEAVQQDLSWEESRLRRIMIGKWRDANRGALVESLVDGLNAEGSPDQIARLVSTAGRGNDIIFTYTKPKGLSETRHVSVQGVSGNSIRARDHKDGKVKNFRIDRISNARNA
jgi:hypothetical protein